jgi:hypothetical protein
MFHEDALKLLARRTSTLEDDTTAGNSVPSAGERILCMASSGGLDGRARAKPGGERGKPRGRQASDQEAAAAGW